MKTYLTEAEWREDALCRRSKRKIDFFPRLKAGLTDPAKSRAAQRVIAYCNVCPVKSECLAYALRHEIEAGIWGGLLPAQRERLSKSSTSIDTGSRCA